jgi:hypothetical protein
MIDNPNALPGVIDDPNVLPVVVLVLICWGLMVVCVGWSITKVADLICRIWGDK